MKITPRIRKMCHARMLGMSQEKAALKAGYAPTSARVNASKIFADAEVREYMATLVERVDFDHSVTTTRVLDELARRSFYDPADFYKIVTKGKKQTIVAKSMEELTPAQRSAIEDYDPSQGVIKLANKDVSLDKLGKHLKLFTDLDTQQTYFVVMPVMTINGKPMEFNVGKPAPQHDPKRLK